MRLFIIVMAMLIIGVAVWQEGYSVNITSSMPIGIYQKEQGSISHGDMVKTCIGGDWADLALDREYLQVGICPSGVQPLLKYVAALEGDMVEITEKGIRIVPKGSFIGCLWSGVRERDRHGNTLQSTLQSGVIKEGQALLMTPHKGSFDGRYFGPISINTLTKVNEVSNF